MPRKLLKTCKKCNEAKSLDEFHKNAQSRDGYRPRCKVCRKADSKIEYKNADAEHRSTIARVKYLRNRDRILKRSKLYRQNNKDYLKQYHQQYLADHLDEYAARTAKRRAMKVQINEDYTAEDRQFTVSLFKSQCFKCKTTNRPEIDHHMPLSLGYPLSRDNAVILCKSCNSSKGNKIPTDFYTEEEYNTLTDLLGGVLSHVN